MDEQALRDRVKFLEGRLRQLESKMESCIVSFRQTGGGMKLIAEEMLKTEADENRRNGLMEISRLWDVVCVDIQLMME